MYIYSLLLDTCHEIEFQDYTVRYMEQNALAQKKMLLDFILGLLSQLEDNF